MSIEVVLITGASSGIGKAIAGYLHSKGMTVYGTSRSAENGEKREGITFVQMDVTDDRSVTGAIELILQREGRIDAVVNNAGIGMVGAAEDSTPEEMKRHFETNYYGPVRVMQAVLPSMRERRNGVIINISSLAGLFGLPYRGVYSAAKYALNGLTESMRMELLQFGIKAVILCPGDYATGIKNNRIEAERSTGSVYAKEFAAVHDHLNEELDSAGDPIEVGMTVWKILNSVTPRVYYLSASPFQKIVVQLKKWLPTRKFQWLMMRNYGMLKK